MFSFDPTEFCLQSHKDHFKGHIPPNITMAITILLLVNNKNKINEVVGRKIFYKSRTQSEDCLGTGPLQNQPQLI